MASVVISGDTSGAITLQSPAVAGTNTVNFGANTGTAILDANTPAFRNRIINGAMVIDQRNAGASVTPTIDPTYTLDRWFLTASQASKLSIQQNAASVTSAVGFTNYLGATSLSAYSVATSDYFSLAQAIEGYNIADLGWGTANAKTVTLSFQVYSSLTGTFGGALRSANANRSYPFSYTISTANTWTTISITIAGDTSGTWLTTNGIGVVVRFGLGAGATYSSTAGAWATGNYFSATGATSVVGTNAATWYITGVQLEKGSTATSFDYRPYGTELQLCQRYYQRVKAVSATTRFASGFSQNATQGEVFIPFPVTMRTAPTGLDQSGTASDYRVTTGSGGGVVCSAVPVFNTASTDLMDMVFTVASGLTAGQGTVLLANAGANAFLGWGAEL